MAEIVDECFASTSYRVGPEVFVTGTTPHSYAACAVARGAVVELSSGLLGAPEHCPELACTGKLGVVWNTPTSGTVFALDPTTEQPTGLAQFYLILYEIPGDAYPHLIRAGNVGANSGYVMDAQLGNDASLACQ